jgi:DNA repair protein RadD
MSFVPRPYQTESINAGVSFFSDGRPSNGVLILPTGSGKSVVIANIAKALPGKTIVFQPSKEILEQNYQKFLSYGFRAGIYSASVGQKHVDAVTFATIGSVARKQHLFRDVQNIVVDEAHLVSPDGGMYHDFIKATHGAKVLGLTATPYRLASDFEGAQLKFITQSSPRIFSRVLHYIQNDVLFNAGHLAKLEYFSFDVINRSELEMNASGTDYTDASMRAYYRKVDMPAITAKYTNYVLSKRRNCLVFCALIGEARRTAAMVPGSVVLTGETEAAERTRVLKLFTSGKITCVINVGVLTTGFDYPELEAVVLARSTMSLALYYQIVGRVMRPHKNKPSGWVVDLGNNVSFFGKIETMKIHVTEHGNYAVYNNGRRLTDTPFTKN